MNHKIVCEPIRPLELLRYLQVEFSLRPDLGSGGVVGGAGGEEYDWGTLRMTTISFAW